MIKCSNQSDFWYYLTDCIDTDLDLMERLSEIKLNISKWLEKNIV